MGLVGLGWLRDGCADGIGWVILGGWWDRGAGEDLGWAEWGLRSARDVVWMSDRVGGRGGFFGGCWSCWRCGGLGFVSCWQCDGFFQARGGSEMGVLNLSGLEMCPVLRLSLRRLSSPGLNSLLVQIAQLSRSWTDILAFTFLALTQRDATHWKPSTL